MSQQKSVKIYSTPTCHFCHMAKDFFNANNVAYTDLNVLEDLTARQEMVQKSGQMGVPVIYIGNEMVLGFDEPRLRELLAI